MVRRARDGRVVGSEFQPGTPNAMLRAPRRPPPPALALACAFLMVAPAERAAAAARSTGDAGSGPEVRLVRGVPPVPDPRPPRPCRAATPFPEEAPGPVLGRAVAAEPPRRSPAADDPPTAAFARNPAAVGTSLPASAWPGLREDGDRTSLSAFGGAGITVRGTTYWLDDLGPVTGRTSGADGGLRQAPPRAWPVARPPSSPPASGGGTPPEAAFSDANRFRGLALWPATRPAPIPAHGPHPP